MNDQPPLTARPRPQEGTAGAPKRRRRPPPPQMSQESRFIGYLVLGFGVVAVVAVLILAFSGEGENERREADPVAVETLVQDIAPPPQIAYVKPQPEQKAPVPKRVIHPAPVVKDLYFKRQPDFNAAQMEGAWQAMVGSYTAVLQMQRGSYQIVYAHNDPMRSRIYSLGTYKVTQDMIEFQPRLDWPAPTSRTGAGYDIMTRAQFPVLAAFQSGRMLWQNPPQSETRVRAPYKSPAMVGQDANYIVWQKLR